MILQALNPPLPFLREFYATNMLRKLALCCIFTWAMWLYHLKFEGFPLLSKSARMIFTHANTRLDKFLNALVVIVLVFGVLANFA